MTPDKILDVMESFDALSELPRTGWLMHGVRPCESVADHSHGVALVAMLLADGVRETGEQVDTEKALRMAVVHDAPEAALGDIPFPVKTPALDQALREVEGRIVDGMMPPSLGALWHELERGESMEARIVKASDKLHMMIKAYKYEQAGRGRLDDFWENPSSFDDQGLPLARRMFETLCARAGRSRPGRPGD